MGGGCVCGGVGPVWARAPTAAAVVACGRSGVRMRPLRRVAAVRRLVVVAVGCCRCGGGPVTCRRKCGMWCRQPAVAVCVGSATAVREGCRGQTAAVTAPAIAPLRHCVIAPLRHCACFSPIQTRDVFKTAVVDYLRRVMIFVRVCVRARARVCVCVCAFSHRSIDTPAMPTTSAGAPPAAFGAGFSAGAPVSSVGGGGAMAPVRLSLSRFPPFPCPTHRHPSSSLPPGSWAAVSHDDRAYGYRCGGRRW